MEINNRVLFDASTYVLFEATGDSEAKHFGGDLESQHSDDDALSCSYFRSVKKVDGGDDEDDNLHPGEDFDFGDWVVGVEDDGGGMSDLEEGVVNQCRGGGGKAAAAAAKEMVKVNKSKGCCEDKSVKMVSEREGDRLFWEACLASQEFNFRKRF
ncbi:hypothetical protein CASFOL_008900 [Castilleja foliolosa]|uniref:Uncharacterized protein n=1 Tax=Castilleja foliolosa TaxID=1961234 RepID=A0ABD3E2C8_9LAMI